MTASTLPITVDNTTYWTQTNGSSDAIVRRSDGSLRFTVHAGDHWASDSSSTNRSEVASGTFIPMGKSLHIAYTLAVQSGIDTSATSWATLGQLHQNDDLASTQGQSPPFAVALLGGKMAIRVSYTDAFGKLVNRTIWSDPNTIKAGAGYAMDIRVVFDANGNGRLTVARNGVTLVNYSGPLGYKGESSVYWKEGIYRGASSSTMVADFSKLSVTTGTTVANAATAPALSGYKLFSATNDYDGATGGLSSRTWLYLSADGKSMAEYRYNAAGKLISKQSTGNTGAQTSATYTSAGSLQQTVAVAADGSRDIAQYGITGQPYVTLLTHKNAAGITTEQQEVFADGSRIVAVYSPAGSSLTSVVTRYAANGTKASTSWSYTNGSWKTDTFSSTGVVTQEVLSAADGTQKISTFSTAGVLQQTKLTSPDGTKVYTAFNGSGAVTAVTKAYTNGSSETSNYASGGKLTQTVARASDGTEVTKTYDTDGKLDGTKIVHSDGDKSYTNYDDGVVTDSTWVYVSGATQLSTYNGSGAVVQTVLRAPDGTELTLVLDKDGSTLQREVLHTDGTRSYTNYRPDGVKTDSTWVFQDGSYETKFFASNGTLTQRVRKAIDGTQTTSVYSGSGALSEVKILEANGTRIYTHYSGGVKTDTNWQYPDGSSETDTYNAGGARTQVTLEGTDGKTTVDTYGASGALTKTKTVYSDGVKVYTDYAAAGYKSVMTVVNAKGVTIATQSTKADGTSVGEALATGVTLYSRSGDDSFTSYAKDTFVFHGNFGHDTIAMFHGGNGSSHDVLQLDRSAVADFAHLTKAQKGADTLVSVSSQNTILLKGVAVSSLTSSDFTFV